LMGGCRRMEEVEKEIGVLGVEAVRDCKASADVLGDCFSILLCGESKVKGGGKDSAEEDVDEDGGGGINGNRAITAQLAAAKGKLLNKIR